MDLEVESQEVAFKTKVIDDIDAKGHLVFSDFETEKTNEVDMDFGFKKEAKDFNRSLTCKALMSEFGQTGLKSSQIKKVVNTMENPSKQYYDVLVDQRKQYKGKEFYWLIKHFQDKSTEDPKFQFVLDLFDDGSQRNIFWADGKSRDSYIKFGDVVFDVTYMTNKFMMPIAPFVGVNHNHSILFGGAL
ncbi:hypothetical protein E3N88_07473 [Mikania micrantha]|uniref:Uncharacterized protein n=1 Tax=Mikania micrantha TaxID=192012 RepID=A0A5N6PTR5_9ASTR|nr:hypothetical protein E3N88_07473 [Mikania micrantha]